MSFGTIVLVSCQSLRAGGRGAIMVHNGYLSYSRLFSRRILPQGSCPRRRSPRGGDFDDLYPDVCVEGLKKDPF